MAEDKRSVFKSLMHPKFIFNNLNHSSLENTGGKSKSKSPVDAYARRRQQVRQAQKNHRQKKENYISALESEVIRLREVVALPQSQSEVQAENQALRELLAVHGVTCRPPTSAGVTNDLVQISLVGEPGPEQHLETEPVQDLAAQGYSNLRVPPGQAGAASLPPPPNVQVKKDAPEMNLDAFDFVMRLEQPCLAHVHPPDGSPQAPGHTLTLQSASFAYAPARSGNGSSWKVPVGEMKRLLDLSAMLPLSGEVTPIQAWSQLMNHPRSPGLTRETLQELTLRLTKKVQCYGFGAVIDEIVFEEILDSFFR